MDLETRLLGFDAAIDKQVAWAPEDVQAISRLFGQKDAAPQGAWRLPVEIKAPDATDAGRSLTFIISTASVDRMGDTIAVDGWKLDEFRKNPVVLWAHDAGSLPVAKASKVWIEDGRLMAQAEFTPPGAARFNDTVFEFLKAGYLNATSVGFQPLKYAFTDDPQRRFGIDFMEQVLLEFSIVPVPANPDALMQARAAGIDVAPIAEWYEQCLRKLGKEVISVEQRAAIERAAKQARLAQKRSRDLDLIKRRSR